MDDKLLQEKLNSIEKKSTEMVWHNRIQTAALILSFFGIVSVMQYISKKK